MALAKVPQVIEHVRDVLENGDKLVIMAHHHDVIDQIAEALAEFGAVKLDGRMSLKDRDLSVSRFQNRQDGARVRRRHPGGGRRHHPHRREPRRVRGTRLGSGQSGAGRGPLAHRIGQTNSVLVQHLVLDGSLDARMAQIIVDKMDVIAAAVDAKDADAALAAPKLLDAPVPAHGRPVRPLQPRGWMN